MRAFVVVVALWQSGCARCWDSPVRLGNMHMTLTGADASSGATTYGMKVGDASGCDSPTDDHDEGGYTFEPRSDALVAFGPRDGALVTLTETTAGLYAATATSEFAHLFEFRVDDEQLDIKLPRYFTATATGIPPTIALVDERGPGDIYGEISTSVVVTYLPTNSRYIGESFVGATSEPLAGDFTRPGQYRIELARTALTGHPNEDWAMYYASVRLTRVLVVDVN